jgi:hypothetical protein
MNYQATDHDLPPIFWPEGQAPEAIQKEYAAELTRFLHICLVYPPDSQAQLELQSKRAQGMYDRALRRDAKDAAKEGRKVFVKFEKMSRMSAWLDALGQQGCVHRMNGWEREFFLSNYLKFKRYFPNVKWVTQKQYDAVESLALRLLR